MKEQNAPMAPQASDNSSRYRLQARLPQFQCSCMGRPSLYGTSSVVLQHRRFQVSSAMVTGILFLHIAGAIAVILASAAPASAQASSPLLRAAMPVVQGQVHTPPQYLSDLRLTLNGGFLSVTPSASGEFEIGPLRPGSYLLQPSHPLLYLPSYLVKVSAYPAEVPQVFALGDSFRPVAKLSLPLIIAPMGLNPPLYFAVKPPFSLLLLLQQPLLLVAIACCALMWCLPRLQQYQEEDERQQRVTLLQQQELLAQHSLARDHLARNQDRYGDGGRSAAPATPWRGDRYRTDADHAVGDEDELSEEYLKRSAFSKCLACIRPVDRGHNVRMP